MIMKVVGNQAWACALSTGWLSIGSMITFAGLPTNLRIFDIKLMGIFGGERCRLQKRRPLRVFD